MAKVLQQFDDIVTAGLEEAEAASSYAVIRIQQVDYFSMRHKDGATERSAYSNEQGAGIYVFTKSGHVAFGATNDLNTDSVRQLIRQLSVVAHTNQKNKTEAAPEIFELAKQDPLDQDISQQDFEFGLIAQPEIAQLQSELEKTVLKLDPTAKTISSYSYEHEQWRIARSDGTDVSFALPKCWFMISATVRKGDDSTQFYVRESATSAPELIKRKPQLIAGINAKLKLAHDQLTADTIGGGHYPILLDHELVGLLAHEALGHPAESDAVAAGGSVLGNNQQKYQVGSQVAADGVNITDHEPELSHGFHPYGSFGNARKEVTIIKDGKLAESVSDIFTSNKIGVANNNCERSEEYSVTAMPRMSTTYVSLDKDKVLADKCEGTSPTEVQDFLARHKVFEKHPEIIYMVGGQGGSVAPSSGDFMFGTNFSYRLSTEGATPIKPVSFSGNVLEALKSIEFGIGEVRKDDFGFCGKNDQRANVSDGGHELILVGPSEHISIA